jgi:hypothetical protein
LQLSLEFLKKIPNPKNFGVNTVYTIPKPKKGGKPILKIILAIVALLVILKKLKVIGK